MPPPPLGSQSAFDFGLDVGGEAGFLGFLKSGGYGWDTKYVAFIKHMVPPGATGSSDVWRLQAERWIGPPDDPKIVGYAVARAERDGLIEKTGRHVAPRDRRSHASAKWEWRRTDKT
jgi:hypothetical protein